jgi:hypothetical protein
LRYVKQPRSISSGKFSSFILLASIVQMVKRR